MVSFAYLEDVRNHSHASQLARQTFTALANTSSIPFKPHFILFVFVTSQICCEISIHTVLADIK